LSVISLQSINLEKIKPDLDLLSIALYIAFKNEQKSVSIFFELAPLDMIIKTTDQ